jgi:hypothetical protein
MNTITNLQQWQQKITKSKNIHTHIKSSWL